MTFKPCPFCRVLKPRAWMSQFHCLHTAGLMGEHECSCVCMCMHVSTHIHTHTHTQRANEACCPLMVTCIIKKTRVPSEQSQNQHSKDSQGLEILSTALCNTWQSTMSLKYQRFLLSVCSSWSLLGQPPNELTKYILQKRR